METIQRAVAKAISENGAGILSEKRKLCTLLEDLVPGRADERAFLETVYSDELGAILSAAACGNRERYFYEADAYLRERSGLAKERRQAFLRIFAAAMMIGMAEVKKYRDYRPALRILKREYGINISREIVQCFVEENRLFVRFSITIDDVMADLADV